MNGRRIRIDRPPDQRGIRIDHPRDLGAHLAGAATKAKLAAILGRWSDPRRPAVLFVLIGEAPFADVFGEDELLTLFPDAPVLHAEPMDRVAPGILRVFIVDERGATIYAIADPRALN